MEIDELIRLVATDFAHAAHPYNPKKSHSDYLDDFLVYANEVIGKRTATAIRSCFCAPSRDEFTLQGHEALLITEEILKSEKLLEYENVPHIIWRFIRYRRFLEKKREGDRRVSADA